MLNVIVVTFFCLFHFRKFYIQQEEQQKNPNRGKKPKCLILWHSLFLLLGLYCWNVYFRAWNDWVVVKFQAQISLHARKQRSTIRVIFVQNVHVVWPLWRGFLACHTISEVTQWQTNHISILQVGFKKHISKSFNAWNFFHIYSVLRKCLFFSLQLTCIYLIIINILLCVIMLK